MPSKRTREARRLLRRPGSATIVFTRGTTESINLVAQGWGRKFLKEGDEVLLTDMEHHSNIVPWQLTAQVTGAVLRYIPLTDDGAARPLGARIAAQRTHEDPVRDGHVQRPRDDSTPRPAASSRARGGRRRRGGRRAARAAQRRLRRSSLGLRLPRVQRPQDARPHGERRALRARREHLDAMDPMFGGGEMIHGGLPRPLDLEGDPVQVRGGDDADRPAGRARRRDRLPRSARDGRRPRARGADHRVRDRRAVVGAGATSTGRRTPRSVAAPSSFWFQRRPPARPGARCWMQEGVAIRAGHHCAQLVMRRFGTPATARASFYVYNTTRRGGRPRGRAGEGGISSLRLVR